MAGTLLIVASVAAVWGLAQWIAAFVLLVSMLGWGAWRVAAALFRPRTVADRIVLALTLLGVFSLVCGKASGERPCACVSLATC